MYQLFAAIFTRGVDIYLTAQYRHAVVAEFTDLDAEIQLIIFLGKMADLQSVKK